MKVTQSCPTLCDPMDCPWNSPGQNTGVGSLSLLQGIFPTQGSNPGLPHCRQILYQLSYKGSPRTLEWVAYPFSRGSSQPRNWTRVSCIAGGFFNNWAIREALYSVQFSRSVVFDSLPPHELQHARPPCLSPTPRVHPNPCPSSRWCHPSNHLIICRPLLLPSIFPSIRVFSNELALHIRWPKYWSFSFSISWI